MTFGLNVISATSRRLSCTPASSAPAAYASASAPHRLSLRGWPRTINTLSEAGRCRSVDNFMREMLGVGSFMENNEWFRIPLLTRHIPLLVHLLYMPDARSLAYLPRSQGAAWTRHGAETRNILAATLR